jgi:L-alanine-DL-glutamate epimerase-like enolase superfamily enzyme
VKIVDIRTIPLSYRCERPYMSAASVQHARQALLLEVETDDGMIGLGEAGLGGGPVASTRALVEHELKPMLVGEDPLMVERLWQKMFLRTRQHGRRGIILHAMSGIDIALWDLVGKVAKLPLYKIFGAYRDSVEVYASGGFYEEGKGIVELSAEAAGYAAQGFRGMKMKIGRNPSTQTNLREMLVDAQACVVEPEEDLARVEAVRKAIGPKMKLMVDVNCVWSPSFAIRMGRLLEPFNLYWIEEPVATDDIRGSAAVAAALSTAVAGYETELGLYGYRELIDQGAIDIAQPDIGWSGGFTECRRIAALAQAHGHMVAPHAYASAVTLAASLHFNASLPNGLTVEFDRTPNPLREDLLKERIAIDREGLIKLPEGPGLGIELEPRTVEKYRLS